MVALSNQQQPMYILRQEVSSALTGIPDDWRKKHQTLPTMFIQLCITVHIHLASDKEYTHASTIKRTRDTVIHILDNIDYNLALSGNTKKFMLGRGHTRQRVHTYKYLDVLELLVPALCDFSNIYIL